MKELAVKLDFGPGRENSNKDFILESYRFEKINQEKSVLIFADSRGSNIKEIEKSWGVKVFNYLKKKDIPCLLVIRPKDCTVFLTLLNFLKLNKLQFDCLVAQIGLVDFTPKKSEIMKDILSQQELFFSSIKFDVKQLSKHRLSSGKEEYLYAINFNDKDFKAGILDQINQSFERALFIETLEVSRGVKLQRERPIEFYDKLKESNKFLFDLCNGDKKMDYLSPVNNRTLSYDGVHYLDAAHDQVANLVENSLEQM